MDALIEELTKWGPLGVLAALMMAFWRKPVVDFFRGSPSEKAVESLLANMNASFAENLHHFEDVSRAVPDILVTLKSIERHSEFSRDHLKTIATRHE